MRRPCLTPRCPEFAIYRGRCAKHSTQRNRSLNRAGRQLYNSKRWKMTRRRKLNQDPLCELGHEGCLGLASEVHHAVALEDGGEPLAMSNLVSSCKPCHSRETRREQQGRGRVAA